MREAVVVEMVRTPVGKRNGMLSGIRAEDLAAKPLREVVKRAGISSEIVDDVIFGCVSQFGEQALDIARVAALQAGYPIEVPGTTVIKDDEGPREDTNLEKLANLKPAFKEDGKITAGNSSQISDGANAILLMSREKAEELGLKPRFRIHTRVVVGSDPTLMLTGVIPATKKAFEKAGLAIDDIDVFEVNEAFAPVPMVWLEETGADPKKLNPNGGAIALGHPLGASGGRLMITMMNELERTGGRFGLQTMCEGHGMANATIIERLD